MTIYSIYKVENRLNGKAYIGFTSQVPQKRWNTHKATAAKPNHPHRRYIHRAINKHGVDNFVFEVIYQSLDKDHTHKVMEPYFIREYDSFENGYNLTQGGEGAVGCVQSEQAKANKRKPKHPGHGALVSAAKKGVPSALRGRVLPREHVNKVVAACSRDWLVTFPDGTEATITNMSEFCRTHNLRPGHMSSVANGKLKAHKGFTAIRV